MLDELLSSSNIDIILEVLDHFISINNKYSF